MIFYDLQNRCKSEFVNFPLTVALGCFDGFHRGHREIIRCALSEKEPCCVFTFSANLFGVPSINSLEQKLKMLAELGVSYACVCDFEEIGDMQWEEFADEILLQKLHCVRAVCGFNFKFGKNAAGNSELLCDFMKKNNAQCIIVDAVTENGETISSTAIRKSLEAGDCERAAKMLGRRYFVEYEVVHGNGLGKTFGYPTINNIPKKGEVKLANGVYICSCNGRPAVTNVGTRPTVVDNSDTTMETFIIGLNENLYGKRLAVYFYKKIRDERKFDSVEDLKKQISLDVEECANYFKTNGI